MSNVYVCADVHWGHKNVANFRPQFSTAEEHHQTMLENILSTVGKRDTLWMLGDICFDYESLHYMKTVKDHCENLFFVMGNHDYFQHFHHYVGIATKMFGITTYKKCWITHCPVHPSELRGRFNVHGHCHNVVIDDPRYRCVSMEQIDYKPALMKDIIQEIKDKTL